MRSSDHERWRSSINEADAVAAQERSCGVRSWSGSPTYTIQSPLNERTTLCGISLQHGGHTSSNTAWRESHDAMYSSASPTIVCV